MSNELQTKSEITINERGALSPQNFEGLYRLATIMAASGLMPKGMDRPETVFVAVQMGLEVGLSPMAAVQNIAVVNGRPTIWGDAMLGLIRGSGLMEAIKEDLTGEGEATAAVCTVWRKGEEHPAIGRFSVADAKRAQLWGKAGPWTQYPRRMLQMRARGFALRDKFPDVLKGLYAREEMEGGQEHYMGEAAVVETGVIDAAVEALVSRRAAAPPEPVGESAKEPEAAPAPAKAEPEAFWPRLRNDDGVWIDSTGAVYNPEVHGWSSADARPAVTQRGVFRAKRGTAWMEGAKPAERQPEPEPLVMRPKDPEPEEEAAPELAGHGVAELQRARIEEATVEGFEFRISAASSIDALHQIDAAVMDAPIGQEARDVLLDKIAIRVQELMA